MQLVLRMGSTEIDRAASCSGSSLYIWIDFYVFGGGENVSPLLGTRPRDNVNS